MMISNTSELLTVCHTHSKSSTGINWILTTASRGMSYSLFLFYRWENWGTKLSSSFPGSHKCPSQDPSSGSVLLITVLYCLSVQSLHQLQTSWKDANFSLQRLMAPCSRLQEFLLAMCRAPWHWGNDGEGLDLGDLPCHRRAYSVPSLAGCASSSLDTPYPEPVAGAQACTALPSLPTPASGHRHIWPNGY